MIPYIDLAAQYKALKEPLDEAISRVMSSGKYTSGPDIEQFEESMERYLGVEHVIACGNGYDALSMSLRALIGKGTRTVGTVLTDSYTHKSTHAAIMSCGRTPIVHEQSIGIDTDFRIPVHMNGRFNVETLKDYTWRDSYGVPPIPVIEDACQAIGASFEGKKAGTVGEVGCFSLHPMKVLSCAGDGGFIATNRTDLAQELRERRNNSNGDYYGVNSRLDNIQAAILNVKLPHLDSFIRRRREIANIYADELPWWVLKPPAPSDGPYFDTYSSYVIGGDPEMLAHLRGAGIECFSHIRTDVVSLPIYPEMPEGDIEQVIAAVKSWRS